MEVIKKMIQLKNLYKNITALVVGLDVCDKRLVDYEHIRVNEDNMMILIQLNKINFATTNVITHNQQTKIFTVGVNSTDADFNFLSDSECNNVTIPINQTLYENDNVSFEKINVYKFDDIVYDIIIPLCAYMGVRNIVTINLGKCIEHNVHNELNDTKKNITEKLFIKHGINMFSTCKTVNEYDVVTCEELSNIVNAKNVFVIRYPYRYFTVSYPVEYCFGKFEKIDVKKFFIKNGYNIITLNDLVNDDYYVYDNNVRQYFENEATTDYPDKIDVDKNKIFIDNSYRLYEKTIEHLLKNNSHQLKNAIVYGFSPFGFQIPLRYRNEFDKLNAKIVAWQDDVQYFSTFAQDRGNTSILEYSNNYKCYMLDMFDALVTPSVVYFDNINSFYKNKVKFMFYTLDDSLYDEISIDNYDNRQTKILLSGALSSGYVTRNEFYSLKKVSKEFNELIDILSHPGVNYEKNKDRRGLNYYKILSTYKSAFVGNWKYPLNFMLAKHIEILMCGCLGFYEDSPYLKSLLGLEPFVHYVPATDNDGKVITDINYYLKYINSDEGKRIAVAGSLHVRNKFGFQNLNIMLNIFNELFK